MTSYWESMSMHLGRTQREAVKPRYWIEPDGYGDDTIWHDTGNPFGPDPIVRRCDVRPEAWELLVRGMIE